MITGINSENRLVQKTFADHLRDCLAWDSIYAYNDETFGPNGTLGRDNEREIILTRDLRAAIRKLNTELPPPAVEDAIQTLTTYDFSRSTLQHNRDFYRLIRDGVPVKWRNPAGEECNKKAQIIDFRNPGNNNLEKSGSEYQTIYLTFKNMR